MLRTQNGRDIALSISDISDEQYAHDCTDKSCYHNDYSVMTTPAFGNIQNPGLRKLKTTKFTEPLNKKLSKELVKHKRRSS